MKIEHRAHTESEYERLRSLVGWWDTEDGVTEISIYNSQFSAELRSQNGNVALVRNTLAQISDSLEAVCCNSERGREKAPYGGALLLPKMAYQHTLPPGARQGAPIKPGN